jgi:hypothetical protein
VEENKFTIEVVITFITLEYWKSQVIDAKGAYDKGLFRDGEE